MSQTKVPAIPAPTDANLRDVARAIKGVLDVREGLSGDPLDANVTFRDLSEGGVIQVTTVRRGGGSGSILVSPGSGSASDGYDPTADLTPPPAPTGFTANGGLTTIFLGWAAATYPNHAYTEIWRAAPVMQGTPPAPVPPVIGNAVRIGTTIASLYSDAVGRTGTDYYYWIRFVSEANVAGPYNAVEGLAAATGKIGNVDLNPLIIEAANLASGAVTASKLAANAVDLTKFANGIEPIAIVTGALPTTKSTNSIFRTDDGKLYRWNGSAYVATVATADLSGTISDAQIAGLAASKVTGQLSDSQIQAVAAAKLTGQVVSSQIANAAITVAKFASGIEPLTIVTGALPTTKSTSAIFRTDDSKTYRWNGTAYVATVATSDLAGTISDAQIAGLAASKVTGQLTNSQIQDVAAAKLTGTITASQIADGAISGTKFASGLEPVSVVSSLPGSKTTNTVFLTTDGKLYRWSGSAYVATVAAGDISGTIGNAQIDGLAASKITGQLTDLQIADIAASKLTGAITETQISDNAISSPKIAAGAISTAKLAAGAVTADTIASNAITSAKIDAGAITTAKIAAGAVTALTIAADAITSDKIAANAVTADEIAANAITSGKISAGAVTATQLSADAVTADKLAANAVTAVKIDAGAVTTAKLAVGAVTADTIAANAVTAAKIDTGAVTAAKIAAGSIDATKIAASTITGDKIAASTITGANIAADTITAGQIAAGAISASELAVGAVRAQHLLVVPKGLNPDPMFEAGAAAWSGFVEQYSASNAAVPSGCPGRVATKFNGRDNFGPLWLDVQPGEVYKVSIWVNRAGTSNAAGWVGVSYGASGSDLLIYPVGSTSASGWQQVVSEYVVPAGVARVRLMPWINYAGGGSEFAWFSDFQVEKKGDASLIVDGAISAAKIAAGAVTTAKLDAGAITSDKIAANAVTSAKIEAGAIVAGKIAAGAIQASDIAAGAVVAGKIAAGAVTANELAADSVTAGKIAAAAVSTNQIAAGAITTNKLLVTGKGEALNEDPNTQDASAWTGSGFSIASDASSPSGSSVLRCSSNSAVLSRAVAIDPTKNYQLRMWVRQQSGSSTTYLTVAFLDGSGNNISGVVSATWPSSGTYYYFGLVNQNPSGTWTEYRISFGPSETAKIPSNARSILVGALANYSGSGVQDYAGVRLMLKADADLIVDGSVIASKIAAGAIAVGSAAIANGAITNAMLGLAIVDEARIANGAITEAKIGNAQITSAKIANTIQSDNWVAGSSGWQINRSGTAAFNSVSLRGSINGGAYTGYAWPSSGIGFHLGPSGLLLGNANGGPYLELQSNGNLYAPGFSIVGGAATFSGALNGASGSFLGGVYGGSFTPALGFNWPASGGGFHLSAAGLLMGNYTEVLAGGKRRYVQINANGNLYLPGLSIVDGDATFSGTLSASIVNTDQIVGGAAAAAASATSTGSSASVTVNVPANASAILIEYFLGPATATYTGGGGKDGGGNYTYGPILTGLTDNGNTTGAIIVSPGAGNHTITVSRSYYSGTMRLGVVVLKR